MKKIFGSILVVFLLLVTFGLSNAWAADPPTFKINFNVQVRDDVSIDMGAVVLLNPNKTKNGSTIMVVNGIGQTANTFIALSERIFTEKVGKKVARIILLNYPGHGNSSLPISTSGVKFGDLTFSDYVTSVMNSIAVLDSIDMAPDMVIAHSLGAEFIQVAQDRLVSQGSSLRKQFGIKSVIFVAPDIIGPNPWAFADSGAAAQAAGSLALMDPDLGNIVRFPPPVYISLFFSDLMGNLPMGTPTPDAAVANGFISDDSLMMATEFLGIGQPRPTVNSGIFASSQGTVASLVTLEQDGLYSQKEHQTVYEYLTNDSKDQLFFFIKGPTTVHNMHVFDTGGLLDVIKTTMMKAK